MVVDLGGPPATSTSGAAAGTPAHAETGAEAERAPAAVAVANSPYQPQWDPVRRAYICWEPNSQQWLQWDDGASAWGPISQ
jgi:hypothetical protein